LNDNLGQHLAQAGSFNMSNIISMRT